MLLGRSTICEEGSHLTTPTKILWLLPHLQSEVPITNMIQVLKKAFRSRFHYYITIIAKSFCGKYVDQSTQRSYDYHHSCTFILSGKWDDTSKYLFCVWYIYCIYVRVNFYLHIFCFSSSAYYLRAVLQISIKQHNQISSKNGGRAAAGQSRKGFSPQWPSHYTRALC